MPIYYFHLSYDIHNADLPNKEQLNHMRFKRWIGCNLLNLGFHLNDISCSNASTLIFHKNFNSEAEALAMSDAISNIIVAQQIVIDNSNNFTFILTPSDDEPEGGVDDEMTNNFWDYLRPHIVVMGAGLNNIYTNFNFVYEVERQV